MTSIDRLRQSVQEIKRDPLFAGLDNNWVTIWFPKTSLQITLQRAQKVKIDVNAFTRAFIDARLNFKDWMSYNESRHLRYRWSEYFRSNMDWNWDTGSCLRNLFKIEKPLPARDKAPFVAIEDRDLLQIKIGGARETMPEGIRVPYADEYGRKRYKTYYPAPKSSTESEYLPAAAEHPNPHMPNEPPVSSLENIARTHHILRAYIKRTYAGEVQRDNSKQSGRNACCFDDLSEASTNLFSEASDVRGLHDGPMDLDYEEGEDTQARISEGQSSDNRDVAYGSNSDSQERGEQVQTAELVQSFDHNQYRDTDEVSYADSTTTYHTASSFRYKYIG